MKSLEFEALINALPKVDGTYIEELYKKERAGWDKKIIVLDDDPTGGQTVHDVSVYTSWDKESIEQGFDEKKEMFYILTNSRGLTEEQTRNVHRAIADIVNAVSKEKGKKYLFISRSDSTLRGHYPVETQVLREGFIRNTGRDIDGEILCPFFQEGRRFTIENVHYVQYGNNFIPVNETEFAQDKTFGYQASTLPEYIEEKTKAEYKALDVVSISLEELRKLELEEVEKKLLETQNFQKVIVNAVDDMDLKIFCIALYRAMKKGKRYLFRTAASFVKVFGNISKQQLLTKESLGMEKSISSGIIIAGSHTEKTTRQIEALKELPDIVFIEFNAALVRNEKKFQEEMERCLEEEKECLKNGKTVCCFTTRELISADTGDKEDELMLSVKISEALQYLVKGLDVLPAFIVAKGGITSSDVAVKALGIKKAHILGQIKPGIPVWKTGRESRMPQIPYIIFPGNVGEDTTLKEVIKILMKKTDL